MKILLDLHKNSASTAFICIVFFLIGYFTSPVDDDEKGVVVVVGDRGDGSTNIILQKGLGGGIGGVSSSSKNREEDRAASNNNIRRRQRDAHYKFQSRIDRIQNPVVSSSSSSSSSSSFAGGTGAASSCHRILRANAKTSLITPPIAANQYEEFARSFHYLSLSLQVSVATERALVLDENWSLLPGKEAENDEDCDLTNDDEKKEATVLEFGGCIRLDENRVRSISCLRQAITSKVCSNNNGGEKNNNIQQQEEVVDPAARAVHPPKEAGEEEEEVITSSSSLAFGIIPDIPIAKGNSLFHAEYYGGQPLVEMPSWPYPKDSYLIDVVPTWERLFGRFWIRSQMVHYLWEQWHDVPSSSSSTTSSTLTSAKNYNNNKPIIAFYWISCKKLRKNLAVKYGRNATVTQDFDRYMEVARRIRKQQQLDHHHAQYPSSSSPSNPPPYDDDDQVDTIYLITDAEEDDSSSSSNGGGGGVPIPDMNDLRKKYPGWNFIKSCSSATASSSSSSSPSKQKQQQQMMMLAKLDRMRKVDYLVGSFQSQMFRLAAELNAAYFHGGGSSSSGRQNQRDGSTTTTTTTTTPGRRWYPMSMRRHWTVDVEWFENP